MVLYQIQLIMTANISSSVFTTSKSIYIRITSSDMTANPVPLGTSLVTSGAEQNLQLNPGKYSIDLDGDQFNASVNDLFFLLMLW